MTASTEALIARLEAAEAGSQEISARVMVHFRAPGGRVEQSPLNGVWCGYDARGRLVENSSRDGWWRHEGWAVTTSLDAALALAERVLPGCLWTAESNSYDGKPVAQAEVFVPVPRNFHDGCGEATAATPALALCIAILKANPTQEEQT